MKKKIKLADFAFELKDFFLKYLIFINKFKKEECLKNYGINGNSIISLKKAGKRSEKDPWFLSNKTIICPICGREEYANAEQEDIEACSLCTMKSEILYGSIMNYNLITRIKNEVFEERNSSKLLKVCAFCKNRFYARSNSQKFCLKCRVNGERMRKRRWKRKSRKERNIKSLPLGYFPSPHFSPC